MQWMELAWGMKPMTLLEKLEATPGPCSHRSSRAALLAIRTPLHGPRVSRTEASERCVRSFPYCSTYGTGVPCRTWAEFPC